MKLSPKTLKLILNLYRPYRGAGIKVEHISKDWKNIQVSMKLHWYNKNIVGTHFGGNLYSMADPHLMLMLMNLLGKGYIVWDKSAAIDFLRPGKGKLSASFSISDEELQGIREKTANKDKFLPEFTTYILDEKQKKVARIKKVLYVRKKEDNSNND